MIEVEHLTKRYGGAIAVDDISFRVEVGDIMGFLGPNGAGKTTTMRILTGYLPPTSGSARVSGYNVVACSRQVRERIGYLPERTPLYLEMTVAEHLRFSHEVKGWPRRKRRANVNAVCEQCGLAEVRHRLIGNLSSGYRQRVGLAQALIGDPPVLILDEPTIGLDPVQVVAVRDLIKSLAQDRTIILSTHILSEVNIICNKVVIINQGRIARQGELASLAGETAGQLRVVARAPEGAKVDAIADVELILRKLSGVAKVAQAPLTTGAAPGGAMAFILTPRKKNALKAGDFETQAARAIGEAGLELLELRSAAPTLEEMFIEATSAPVQSMAKQPGAKTEKRGRTNAA
jgi:ABC-2 type transport system ATP-binding protein